MLQAPFTYFGGKSRAAPLVWRAIGDVDNYIEPFFGSGATLLMRPGGALGVETVNDIDAYLANFWRAVRAEPDAVADEMNWPVNETDLEARHKWLVTAARKREHGERMRDAPDYYDVRIAAWWCWGMCAWIGSGWCGGEWNGRGETNSGRGINVRDEARGGKLPHLGDAGMGVHRQLPRLSVAGVGVHRKLPHLGSAGMGECERRGEVLQSWMQALSDRLRAVRVCCGDWLRCCGSDATTTRHGLTGVFLDPPYSAEAGRDGDIYRCEDLTVAHRVREWAIERGRDPMMRIVLAGYESEHEFPDDWRCVPWNATGGYANIKKNGTKGKANSHRERLWCSPHCVGVEIEGVLFNKA